MNGHGSSKKYKTTKLSKAKRRVDRPSHGCGVDKVIDTRKHTIPSNMTNDSKSNLMSFPDLFALPLRSDVKRRIKDAAFPIVAGDLLGDQNEQLESKIPERRIINKFQAIKGQDNPIFTSSSYSVGFLYELVHHLFYFSGDHTHFYHTEKLR